MSKYALRSLLTALFFHAALQVLGTGCSFPADYRVLLSGDTVPPRFVSAAAVDVSSLLLLFDKSVSTSKEKLFIEADHRITDITLDGSQIMLHIDPPIPPGERRTVSGYFEDADSNRLHLITAVYGFNPNTARLIINEFTTRGSANHPDRIELLVTTGGCTAGITLYDGTKQDYRQIKILPPLEVNPGDYIIVHCRELDPPHPDEAEDRAAASVPGTHDEAWDVWIQGGIGLSGNNGVITLYDSPSGDLMDGLFYSDRTSDSDERYRGFGSSSMLKRTAFLCMEGGWDADHETVRPEDGVPSTYSTATRSMSRLPGSYTRTRDDWIIVPTRGSTFGYENKTEAYIPEP